MSGSDIVPIAGVVIGAAALIPQVIQWISKAVRKPALEILSARAIRIGYTSFGPFLQLPVSISSRNRDVIVTQMNVLVRHQSQEQRLLEWNSITEPLMNIPIPTGENLPFQKTQNVLAIKAINETLTERIITFADPRFASAAQEKVNTARENFKYLRGQGKETPTEEIIRSKEFQQADRFLTDNIFWREGTYHLEIEISGRELKTQHREVFEVTLAGRDIEDLQANLQLVREDLQNQITKGDRPRPQWIYIHPPIRPAME